ncbi:signal peptidase I SipW [Sutcliffiella horikoshii]|uniref:signal peptidase I SipW n=1 Tax=Sutcliffiella horikoshii TaxID=79883 RepID=UPI003CF2086E
MKILLALLWKLSKLVSILLFFTLFFIVLSAKASGGEPTILGHQLKVVLSGSMEPTFMTGSIILMEKTTPSSTFKKNDVITFRSEDILITHRIIDIKDLNGKEIYQTKGDNNNAPDPVYVTGDQIVGKYADLTIPYIGFLVNVASTKEGSTFLLVVPGILLVASAGLSIVRALREFEKAKTA